MALAKLHNRMLFELRPDLFGDFLGETEMELWELFYEDQKTRAGVA